MSAYRTVKVKDLKKGDELASGGVIAKDPVFIGTIAGQKDRAKVIISSGNALLGNSVHVWGWFTTVKIKSNDK